MGSYHQLYFHVVLVTYRREKVFTIENESILFDFMKEIAEKKDSEIESINAAENHIHLLIRLHPAVALSDMVKELKSVSNRFIKENKLFPKFNKWQTGYSAFSVSKTRKETVIKYIANQKQHHKIKTFEDEH